MMIGGALATLAFVSALAVMPTDVRAADPLIFPDAYWGKPYLEMIEKGPRFLPRDFDTGVATFPANDSTETRTELDAMLKMQESERTEEQLKWIQLENNQSRNYPNRLFHAHRLFNINTYPMVNATIIAAVGEVSYFIMRDKMTFKRARPTQLEPRLKRVIDIPGHAAFPSGHAGQNYIVALLLGALDPANKDKYEQLAIDIAHRREVAGLHYPSDSVAGRTVATHVFDGIMKDQRFKALFDAAQEEYKLTPPTIPVVFAKSQDPNTDELDHQSVKK